GGGRGGGFPAAWGLPTWGMVRAVALLWGAHAKGGAPAYVSATVLVVAWTLRQRWRNLIIFSIALHLAVVALLFNAREISTAFGFELPAQYDALRRVRGWRDLGSTIGRVLAAHPGLTLFADDREVLAALIYYIRPHPLDAVKWQVTGRIQDQWDLMNSLSKHL